MCSNGILRIVGDAEKAHHDKNTQNNRTSITVLRVGAAGGINGPVIFIAKGESIHDHFKGDRLHRDYGLPEESCVIPNKNGYMDDETWEKVVDVLAPAIRKMKVNCCLLGFCWVWLVGGFSCQVVGGTWHILTPMLLVAGLEGTP